MGAHGTWDHILCIGKYDLAVVFSYQVVIYFTGHLLPSAGVERYFLCPDGPTGSQCGA